MCEVVFSHPSPPQAPATAQQPRIVAEIPLLSSLSPMAEIAVCPPILNAPFISILELPFLVGTWPLRNHVCQTFLHPGVLKTEKEKQHVISWLLLLYYILANGMVAEVKDAVFGCVHSGKENYLECSWGW